jgi:phage shock protein C
MSLADELTQLEQLRERGSLSDDEFARAKQRLLQGTPHVAPGFQAVNGYRRAYADRWFGGVCGGLGVTTGIASWVWRIIFAIFLIAGGTGLVVYLIIWIFAPLETSTPALSNRPLN